MHSVGIGIVVRVEFWIVVVMEDAGNVRPSSARHAGMYISKNNE